MPASTCVRESANRSGISIALLRSALSGILYLATMEVDDSAPFFAHNNNWDDILHPKSLHDVPFHERPMQNGQPQPPYSHQDLDAALHTARSSSQQLQRSSQLNPPNFDSAENLDLEHQNYDLFSSVPPFGGARFRSYSSASSVGPSPSLPAYGQDLLYPNPTGAFHEGVSSLTGPTTPYDANPGLSSSYSGGSGSPVPPQDSATVLHRASYSFSSVPGVAPPTVDKVSQDYNGPAAFSELMLDRRPSNPEHFDDFGLNARNVFGGAPQTRISEPMAGFPADFSHASGAALPPRQKSSLEMFCHVAPQATHGFKIESNNPGFQEGYQYGLGVPQGDLALRLPVTTMGVDETLSRMKLQAHPGSGGTDLQSFIRLARIFFPACPDLFI